MTAATLMHQGFFHLRNPLLSATVFEQWQQAEDKVAFLLAQLRSPHLREAIYIASPNLYERLTELELSRDTQATAKTQMQVGGIRFEAKGFDLKGNEKLINALARYVARAAYRCTPFGLFSTVTLGQITSSSDFSGIGNAPLLRHVEYDAWIEQLMMEKVCQDTATREALLFKPNSSLLALDQNYYYTEVQRTQIRSRFVLSRIRRSQAVELALNHAKTGIAPGELAEKISLECEVSGSDARDFTDELITSQLLLPALAIPVIGGLRLRGLHAELTKIGHAHHTEDLVQRLTTIREKARTAHDISLIEDYRTASAVFGTTVASANARDTLFQVDCQRTFTTTLSEELVNDIRTSATALSDYNCFTSTVFDEHKKLFAERFGEREVPLEIALHSEIGVPFPSQTKAITDLLDGIQLGNTVGERQSLLDLVRTQILAGRLAEALGTAAEEIHISDADIEHIRQQAATRRTMGGGMFALAALIGDGSGAPRFILQQIGGRSGAEMLGRFTHMDPQLAEHVKLMLQRQEELDPQCIYAEINHDCGGRLNNIVTRAALRRYEIVCLGHSALPLEHQIPTSDLLLRLDQGQYRLRSKRLGREVIPRLSTAHNYSYASLGLYQFLAALQWQDAPGYGPFIWPEAFSNVKYLPRVRYGNSVWALARWRFDQDDAAALAEVASNAAAIREWRNTRTLPRFVTLDFADNSLPVDLENSSLVRMLLEEIEGKPQWELAESLTLNNACTAPTGYSKEVVVPFSLAGDIVISQQASFAMPRTDGYRSGLFPPGTAWTYLKVYCGPLQADNLLIDKIGPLMERAQADGRIDRWFFIRYADPDHHVRVRFHGDPSVHQKLSGELIAALTPALHDYQCTRLAIDTYEQELDRYGGPAAIALAEGLFHHDSVLAVSLLSMLRELDDLPARWAIALLGLESWLNSYSPTIAAQLEVMNGLRNSFKHEFGIGAVQKVQMGTKFRSFRSLIDSHFFSNEVPSASMPVLVMLRNALPQRRLLLNQLHGLEQEGSLQGTTQDMMRSFIHMFCNRILDVYARKHEAVLYDFMVRILMSKQSRAAAEAEPR